MAGIVAVRECSLSHCCIAASQDCGGTGCVLQSLLGPIAINLVSKLEKRSSDPLPGTIQR